VKLRRFTPDGIEAFRDFLRTSRATPTEDFPTDLLEHRTLTDVVEPAIPIAESQFETKGDAARYLATILGPISDDDLRLDAGLWTWLSLLYLDSVCQHTEAGRVINHDHFYIFYHQDSRRYYRHLLFISWRLLRLTPTNHRLFLTSQLSTLDKVTEVVVGRLFLTRIPAIFELLDRLYWDEKNSRPKRGITNAPRQRGSLTPRLSLRISQLEKTYDLMSLTADQLIELLGEEFSFARPASKRLFAVE
jgi:hypothetical protein